MPVQTQIMQRGFDFNVFALTFRISTLQPLLFIFDGLHLGLVDISESSPLSPVDGQPFEHWVDLYVETRELLQTNRHADMRKLY